MTAMTRFLALALLGALLWLSGCGGGGAPAAPPPPEETHLLLAAVPDPGLTFTEYREVAGDFGGYLGTPAAVIAEDAHTARWLPYWTALHNAAQTRAGALTAEVDGVVATCTFTPRDDTAFPYAISVTRGEETQPIITGTLGPTGAQLLLHNGAQTLGTLALTRVDTAQTIELHSARHHLLTQRTLSDTGAVRAATTRLYGVAAGVETLQRELRFDIAGQAAPDELADACYAVWEYHPTLGEPGTGLRAKVFTRLDHSGVLKTYAYGTWQTTSFSPM